MSHATRLRRLEQLLRSKGRPVSDVASREADLYAGDVWKYHFARGRVLPLPVGSEQLPLVRDACGQARGSGFVGPADYLAGMTPAECEAADRIEALFRGLDPGDATTARDSPAVRFRTLPSDPPGTFALWHRWPVALLRWEWVAGGFTTRAQALAAADTHGAEGDYLIAAAGDVPKADRAPDFTTMGTAP